MLSLCVFVVNFCKEKKLFDCPLSRTRKKQQCNFALFDARSLRETAQRCKPKSNQKKQKEAKEGKNHLNFIRHIFTPNRHTKREKFTRQRRDFDFASVKRRRSLRRSTLYSVLQKRLCYSLSSKTHQNHNLVFSTFLKIQRRER